MKPRPYSILVFLVLGLSAFSQPKKPTAGKAPSWTTMNKFDYNDNRLVHEAEDGYFDIEYEQQVSLAQQSVFYRRVVKILTEAGIQNSSEISVNFDPSYQQLTFHSIKIIRGRQTINQLDLSRIRTIQQEKELNRFLYNGSLTSILFLEDVRKGDIIEYSYTIRGFNPIFKGKYSGVFDLNYRVPLGCIYYKLAVPGSREVIIRNSNSDIQPVVVQEADETVYEWKLTNVKALHTQDNLPSWYDPFAIVMVSEYKSWKEVNDWALNIFPARKNLSVALQKKISEIIGQNDSEEERVLGALRFVQDDIRYLGIEMGISSHKPGDPNKIFAQRFGDCKDKSYLLCTMLNEMGIQAAPVLINTWATKSLATRLPSALAFDHMTVRITLANGKQHWVDPTISFQRGSLDNIYYPDYQYGLVVQPGTDALTPIQAKEKGMTQVREVFDIPDMSGKAALTVLTHYTGSYADNVRSSFNNSSLHEMQKTYRDYYANYYENITCDSIVYTDDDATGKFTTTEYYSITDLWKLENGVKKATFESYVINGVMKRPKDSKRTMPFLLEWPAKYREVIEVNVPEDWDADESSYTVNTPGFKTNVRSYNYGSKTIYIEYEYENIKDHIAPSEMKEYLEGLDSKEKRFGYEFSRDEGSVVPTPPKRKKKTNYLYMIGIILLIGGVVWWTQRR